MTTITVNSPTTVGTDTFAPISCREFTSAKVLVVYNQDSAADLRAKIADVSGTTISFLGAEATVDTSTPIAIALVQLDSSRILCVYSDVGPDCRAMVIQRSGDTVTTNTSFQLNETDVDGLDATLIDTDKVLVVFTDGAASNVGKSVILTISGTTVTVNTTFSFHTGSEARNVCTDVISTTRALVCYSNRGNGDRATGQVLDISGTTITGNTEYQLNTDDTWNLNERTMDCQVWSSTKAYVQFHSYTANVGRGVLLALSGTVVSVDDDINAPPTRLSAIRVIIVDSSNVLTTYVESGTSNARVELISFSGATLTIEDNILAFTGIIGGKPGICQLASTDYLMGYAQVGGGEDECRIITLSAAANFDLVPSVLGLRE